MGKDIVGCSVAEVSSEAFSAEGRKILSYPGHSRVREVSTFTEA